MAKTPHIELIARGVLHRGQWLLLCQNTDAGYYYLPGGHVEFGESAAAALRRELIEEAELLVQVGACLLITEASFESRGKDHHELNLVFHVELEEAGDWDGSGPPPRIKSQEKDIAFEWIDIASIIDTDLRPEAIKAWLMTRRDAAAGCEWVSSFPAET